MNKKRRKELDVIKGIAVVSVFSAHCNNITNYNNYLINSMSLILQHFGTFGVGCFFIIAGILYHKKKSNKKMKQLLSRINKIIEPWLISSIVIYLYVHLRKPPISLINWFNFFIGNGSYLYYLTVLFIFYILYLIPQMYNKKINVLLIIISILSMCFFCDKSVFSPYLNIFNWIGYFSLGIIIQDNYESFVILINKYTYMRYFFYIMTILLVTFQINKNIVGSYWELLHVFTSFFGIISIFLFGFTHNQSSLSNLGLDSLFFYLWHMPIASMVARLFNLNFLSIFVLLRPFVVCLIMCLLKKSILNIFGFKCKKIFGLI